jgi:hypothetical protein
VVVVVVVVAAAAAAAAAVRFKQTFFPLPLMYSRRTANRGEHSECNKA